MTPRSRSRHARRPVTRPGTRWWVYGGVVLLLIGVAVLAYAALSGA